MDRQVFKILVNYERMAFFKQTYLCCRPNGSSNITSMTIDYFLGMPYHDGKPYWTSARTKKYFMNRQANGQARQGGRIDYSNRMHDETVRMLVNDYFAQGRDVWD